MSADAAILALLDRIERLERGGERIATQSVPLVKLNQLISDGGSIALPGFASFANPDTGLAMPLSGAPEAALVAGGAVAFRVTSANTTTRAYILDRAWNKNIIQVIRGDTNVGATPDPGGPALYAVAPDPAVSAGLYVVSHQKGDNLDASTGEAIKGHVRVWGGKGGFQVGVSGVVAIEADGDWAKPDVGAYVHGAVGVFGQANVTKNDSRAWGANFIAQATAGLPADLTGVEVDVKALVPVTQMVGHKVVIQTGSLYGGTVLSYGYQLADKNAPQVNAALLDVGFVFGGAGFEAMPIKTAGTLIKTFGTRGVAHGIDFSSIPISGYSFIAANFSVTGAGAVTATGAVASGALVSGTSLAVNAAALIGTERVYVDGNVLLSNNSEYQIRESGGAARKLVTIDGSDVAHIGNANLPVVFEAWKHGFYGGAAITQPSGGSASTDLASVITLANLLRTSLRNLNLLS